MIIYTDKEYKEILLKMGLLNTLVERDDAFDFVIQYLYSEHQICDPEDEAAPYTPEELKAMAIEILKNR